MSKFGFLSVLEEEMDKHFQFDYAMDWDKRNHSLALSFILEAQNSQQVVVTDMDGEAVTDDVALEEFVLFYNPAKSRFDAEDYLVTIPYEPKKGFSREFLAYFAQFLNQVAEQGLDDLMDFLSDEEAEEFALVWNQEAFDAGLTAVAEGETFPYPRY